MMRTDLPKLDPAYVEHVMLEYLKGVYARVFMFELILLRFNAIPREADDFMARVQHEFQFVLDAPDGYL